MFAGASARLLAALSGLPGVVLLLLSGLLIGAEIATGMAAGDEPLCLVATGGMAERYAAALTALGIDFDRADAEDAVRNGLFAMAARIWPERELLETDA